MNNENINFNISDRVNKSVKKKPQCFNYWSV